MRDGRRFDGTVVSQNRTQIVILVNGNRVLLNKTEMMRVVFADLNREAELKRQQEQDDAARQEAIRREEAVRAAEAARQAEQRRLQEEARQLEEKRSREAKEQARKDTTNTGDRSSGVGPAFLRSAFLPGWGQYYQGRETSAMVYGFGFLGSLGLVGAAVQSARSIQSDYRSAAMLSQIFLLTPGKAGQLMLVYSLEKRNHARAQQQHRARMLTGATAIAVGIYGANLLSVYWAPAGGRTALVFAGGVASSEVSVVVRF